MLYLWVLYYPHWFVQVQEIIHMVLSFLLSNIAALVRVRLHKVFLLHR